MSNLWRFAMHFENPTVNLSALCNSCPTMACCSSELIFTLFYAGSSIDNEREQFVSFVTFALHPAPQRKTNAVSL
jgi:hypothetical protein